MAELGAIQDDVRFDWSGAERLAAEFRATAGVLEGQVPHRNAIAGQAKQEWRGAYAEQFTGRMRTCAGDAQRLADAMRTAASQVDELARLAREEQTRRERARDWMAQQEDESLLEKAKDFVFGEDDKPPVPPPVEPRRFTSTAPVAGSRG